MSTACHEQRSDAVSRRAALVALLAAAFGLDCATFPTPISNDASAEDRAAAAVATRTCATNARVTALAAAGGSAAALVVSAAPWAVAVVGLVGSSGPLVIAGLSGVAVCTTASGGLGVWSFVSLLDSASYDERAGELLARESDAACAP